ncbi:hypothetical protein [Enterococcus avium]|uniref:hypothetical protein n=1 Tax=Enterococcus avium TaxID=33945 RepID=UPI001F599CF6|nr:hypothetical protein [Enterococcus avium]
MENAEFFQLKIGDIIEVPIVGGGLERGKIEAFEEKTIIISKGVERFVVSKKELSDQGYTFPKVKKKTFSNVKLVLLCIVYII